MQEELAAFAARQRFASDDGLPTSTDAIFLAEALAEENQKENSPPHVAPRSPIKILLSTSPLGSRPGTPPSHSHVPINDVSPSKTPIPRSGHLIASSTPSPLRTSALGTATSPARIPRTAPAGDAPGFSSRTEEDEFLSVTLNMAGSPVVDGAVPGGFAAAPHDNLRGMSSWVLPDKTLDVRLGGEREGVASHPIADAGSRSRSVSVSPPQRFASASRDGDDAARPSGAARESGSDSGPEWVAFQDFAGTSEARGVDAGAVRSAFAPCEGEEDWEDGEPPPHTVSLCLSPSVPLSRVCVCVCVGVCVHARVYIWLFSLPCMCIGCRPAKGRGQKGHSALTDNSFALPAWPHAHEERRYGVTTTICAAQHTQHKIEPGSFDHVIPVFPF
jgi:hypothetical protein